MEKGFNNLAPRLRRDMRKRIFAHAAGTLAIIREKTHRHRNFHRVRLHHESGAAVLHQTRRFAGVGAHDYRLVAQHRFDCDVTEILLLGDEQDGERIRIQIQQFLIADETEKNNAGIVPRDLPEVLIVLSGSWYQERNITGQIAAWPEERDRRASSGANGPVAGSILAPHSNVRE